MEISAASLALFDRGNVLLIKRARPPYLHHWTLPGGRLEAGETPLQCAVREVREETGLCAEQLLPVAVMDIAAGPSPYWLEVFAANHFSGSLKLSEEIADCRWAEPESLDGLIVTPGLASILAEAAAIVGRLEHSARM